MGLSKDIELIISLIEELGIPVIYRAPLSYKRGMKSYIKYIALKIARKCIFPFFQYLPRQKNSQIINIFLEHMDPYYCYKGDINCFMPNPELCNKSDIKFLSKTDYVLCKTLFTQKIFNSLSLTTYYTGFTSEDRLDIQTSDKSETFFHLAGNSPQKGTDVLVDLWLMHPEWPLLTVVQKSDRYKREHSVNSHNIHYILEYLDNDSLKKLQNENLFHLCPSEAEGFGHYIVEAMSCKAITLTTDAPPMNELLSDKRGVLVKYKSKKPQRLGMNYYVDENDLEKQIIKILNMSKEEKKQTCKNARQWFMENDRNFRSRFKSFIYTLTEKKM